MSSCVIIFDVTGMYPYIVMGKNISPEMKEVHEVMGVRVVKFRKDKMGLIPQVIKLSVDAREGFRKLRLEAETDELREKYAGMEKSAKVGANATYGVMLYPPFRLYDKDCAEAITDAGRRIIRRLRARCLKENIANQKLKKLIEEVLYGDTDSLFILLNCSYKNTKAIKAVSEYLNNELKILCEEQGYRVDVEGKVESVFERIVFKYRPAKTHERSFAESISGKMVVGAKKKYAGKRRWVEGRGFVDEHYIKGFGRSDVSIYTKQTYEALWEAILDKASIDEAVRVIRKAWLDVDKQSWYTLSVPRGVRANFKEYTEDAKRGGHIAATLYMIDNLGIEYNPMIKPRAVRVKPKTLHGKERKLPDTKRIALLNGMTEPPKAILREFDIDYYEQAKTILERPFELLIISLGRQWSEATHGTRQRTLDSMFGEISRKKEEKERLDSRLEASFNKIASRQDQL